MSELGERLDPPAPDYVPVTVRIRLADGRRVELEAEAPAAAFVRGLELEVRGELVFAIPFTLDDDAYVRRNPDEPSPLDWL